MTFRRLLSGDGHILLDGAMGSVLQQHGLKLGGLPEELNFTEPDLIRSIHRSYIEAGAQGIYANTFGANRHKLQNSKYTVEQIVKQGIKLAREAAEGTDVLVGLDIGSLGRMLRPTGDMPVDEAYDMFREVMTAGREADFIAIETMTDLYETKAAVLAAKEHSDKPVFVTMTFEENGRTFTGCTVSAMALTLEGLGVDALGVNCSLGPKELLPVVEEICRWTTLPVIVKPNAGLPDPVTGAFSVLPDDFAEAMAAFAKLGVSVFGGCCGTTPEHLAAAYQKLDSMPVVNRPMPEIPPAICSPSVTIPITEPRIIGERINPTGKKRFQAALKANDIDYILEQAVQQTDAGADILDVNVGLPEIDEKDMMIRTVKALQSIGDTPLQLDSTIPEVLEAALRVYNGKPIVNSVNGEEASLQAIFRLSKSMVLRSLV